MLQNHSMAHSAILNEGDSIVVVQNAYRRRWAKAKPSASQAYN